MDKPKFGYSADEAIKARAKHKAGLESERIKEIQDLMAQDPEQIAENRGWQSAIEHHIAEIASYEQRFAKMTAERDELAKTLEEMMHNVKTSARVLVLSKDPEKRAVAMMFLLDIDKDVKPNET